MKDINSEIIELLKVYSARYLIEIILYENNKITTNTLEEEQS
jgi:hypothetical protein